MKNSIFEKLVTLLNENITAFDLTDRVSYQPLLEAIGDSRIVLMGEATHGTQEFYQARMNLSEFLIKEKGFQAIAIEGDWTSAYQIDQYLQGVGESNNPYQALEDFKRFPAWMWRNKLMLSFIKKLRLHNDSISDFNNKVSFYGLDLYCLHSAMQAVIDFLQSTFPKLAEQAVKRYACFDHTTFDPQQYGYLTEHHLKKDCVKEVTEQLLEMQRHIYSKIEKDAESKSKNFYALQNARLVKNSESYYRSLFEPHYVTWNIRDQHMVDTIQNIIAHLENTYNIPAKIIVWAHNSHVGDARATEMSVQQEVNLGQLVRERFSTSCFSLGFSTALGTVTAASYWDGSAEYKNIIQPIEGSYEQLFHSLELKNFILNLKADNELSHLLNVSRLQRAIGVIYRPETERASHYFFTRLPYQFDVLIHLDKTSYLEFLEDKASNNQGELPDTYPEGY